MSQIAAIICTLVIIGLFYLDRDRDPGPSMALWIPFLWLGINASRPVSAWLGMAPIVPQAQQYEEGSPLDAAVFGLLILSAVLVLNRRSHKLANILRANISLVLFFTYCGISVLWSDYPFIALKRYVKGIGDLAMIMIVLTDPRPLTAIKRLLSRITFILLPLSVLFIRFFPNLGSTMDGDRVLYNGVAETKNSLGILCILSGLVSLWSLIEAWRNRDLPHRTRHLIVHGLMFVTAAWLVVACDSMTSLSCLGLGSMLLLVIAHKRFANQPGGVHALAGFAIGVPLLAIFVDTMGSLLQPLGRNSTLTGRTAIWEALLSMHTNPLIGTGYESFWLGGRLQTIWQLAGQGLQEAHNGYIEVYLNLGWAGLILLGTLALTGYRQAHSLSRRDPHAGSIRLAWIVVGLVYSLTEAGFRIMSPVWIPFLMATTILPSSAAEESGLSRFVLQGRRASSQRARILQ